jgi:rhodanese-related sulfurtransferase
MLGRLAETAADWPREQPVAVHCQGGARSPIAASVLRRAGFTRVLDVHGGFAEHVRLGLPVETGAPQAVS